MATKSKTPAPAPRRKALAEPPAPKAAAPAPVVGFDPRDGSQVSGTVAAAPPTPTVETALTANDGPGAGGAAEAPVPRRKLAEPAGQKRTVHVARAFILTDSSGAEHRYGPGPQEMPADHADHWYTKAHLVKG